MTRKMRRIFAFSIAALLVVGIASGVVLAKKTTIVHWQHHSPARKEMVEAFAAEFMQKNPDIDIQIESIPETDYFQKLLPALAAGAGPDTFQIPAGQVSSYAATGVLQPISPKVATAAQIEADFVPSAVKRLKMGADYYGFPVDTQTIVLFYNPELFKAAGLDPAKPPQTWAELIEYAKAIHKRDANGVTTQMGVATGGYGPVLASLMLQNGASLWNSATDLPDFSSPAAAEALKFATDLVTEYKVEDRQMGSRWNAFRQSKLGMVFAHPAMIGSFRATVPDLVYNIAQIPAPKPGGPRTTLLTSWAYVVSRKAPSEAASKWIAYLTSADAQKRWITKTGDLPTRKALLDLPEYKNDRLLGPCMESMKNSVPAPWTTRQLDDELLRKAYELVILKNESPEKAMKWLSEEAIKAEKEQKALAKP